MKIINLKCQLRYGMKSLDHLMDHILYQVFKFISNIFKKYEAVTNNPSIMIYVSKTENRITFKITCATMKLLESTKSKINKEK